jgi:hypothetical protein
MPSTRSPIPARRRGSQSAPRWTPLSPAIAGFMLAWQHLEAARNVQASAAIMRGDPEPMRKMLDTLLTDSI